MNDEKLIMAASRTPINITVDLECRVLVLGCPLEVDDVQSRSLLWRATHLPQPRILFQHLVEGRETFL